MKKLNTALGLLLLICFLAMGTESYGQRWMLTFSKGTGYGPQAYNWTAKGVSNASNKIKDRWDAGYDVVDLAYGSNTWLITFAKRSGYTKQAYNWTQKGIKRASNF